MSLHALAQTLQKQGRGDDTVLIHMTPGEVAGLQSLALAKGGSLTVNPATGLPEAGFLSDILPSLVGIGANLMFPGLGALGTGMAAGLTSYATSGDPSKALLSGLLAGGGAGLMGGVESAGMDTASAATREAAQRMGTEAVAQQATNPAMNPAMQSMFDTGAEGALRADIMPPPMSSYAPAAPPPGPTTANLAYSGTPDIPTSMLPTQGGNLQAGFDKVTSSGDSALEFLKKNKYAAGAAGLGLMGLASGSPQGVKGPTSRAGTTGGYRFNPTTRQYELDPSTQMPYTYFAAEGGTVPAQNAMYPQANIAQTRFTDPTQIPQAGEVVGDYDAQIDKYGDVSRMADGGVTGSQISSVPYGLRTNPQSYVQLPPALYGGPTPGGGFAYPMSIEPPQDSMPQPRQGGMASIGGKGGSRGMPPPSRLSAPPSGLSSLGQWGSPFPVGLFSGLNPSQPPSAGTPARPPATIGGKGGLPGVPPPVQVPGGTAPSTPTMSATTPYRQAAPAPIPAPAPAPAPAPEQTPALGGVTYDPATQTYIQAPAPIPAPEQAPEAGPAPRYYDETNIINPYYGGTGGDGDYVPSDRSYEGDKAGGVVGRKMAAGGIADSPEYAAGGKLLQGPGDGMSDSIPAVIKGPRPQRAALAQGEFVVPADVVSHLGNGSTDAGAKHLYAMMDRVRTARTGNKKQGKQIKAGRFMPA